VKILVTGSGGFIGKNLMLRLSELNGYEPFGFTRDHSLVDLENFISKADAVVHLAGINRPLDVNEFSEGNIDLTVSLCKLIQDTGRKIPLIFASSIQAVLDNPYGQSKRAAELAVESLAKATGNSVAIYRLPNVFGKWCRPNYNSVVATFCHNLAHELAIRINNATAMLKLVYVDDVVEEFISSINNLPAGLIRREVSPVYEVALGALANQIKSFQNSRDSLISEAVGTGFVRALYSTYLSYLPPTKFAYEVPKYGDERGIFVEMLKTKDSGQFSFFTAHPGVTRGGHYHHTKTEKFLVIKGNARFGFRQILTNEFYEIVTSGDKPKIVETVPGWTHDITNIGSDEMIVMLWANEIFDRAHPDTVAAKV
jgi:UDP-2-acetamido-2,6-beta-L-arabino-hexul-4-ose reductase